MLRASMPTLWNVKTPGTRDQGGAAAPPCREFQVPNYRLYGIDAARLV